jgi:DNA-directed RNA polymerase subunit E'/Rpb7
MFSTVTLIDTIKLRSDQIGPDIRERIIHSLKKNYEKKVLGKINGYIIEIVDVNEDTIKDGVINDINGDINYKLEYTAVMFKPIKGDILDITVDHCNDLGIWGHSTILSDVSIIECICTKNLIPDGFIYNEEQDIWGFDYIPPTSYDNSNFDNTSYYQTLGVEKNASQIDIRKNYIKLIMNLHPDKNNEKSHEKFTKVQEAYEALKGSKKNKDGIEKGTELKLKIINTQINATQILIIGSIVLGNDYIEQDKEQDKEIIKIKEHYEKVDKPKIEKKLKIKGNR